MAIPRNRGDSCLVYRRLVDLDRHRRMRLGLPIRKKSRGVPFGYRVSDTDASMLEPIDEQFQMLIEAKKQLASASYRDISDWLTVHSGRRISHQAIQQLYTERMPFDEAALPREEREKLLMCTLG